MPSKRERSIKICVGFQGDIVVGSNGSCQASSGALVTAIKSNGLVTVKLLPFGNEKQFDSLSKGKIR